MFFIYIDVNVYNPIIGFSCAIKPRFVRKYKHGVN